MNATDIATLRQYLPEKSTEIKVINGYYYVYRYTSKKLDSGRWGKSSGKCIGKIVSGKVLSPTNIILRTVMPLRALAQSMKCPIATALTSNAVL